VAATAAAAGAEVRVWNRSGDPERVQECARQVRDIGARWTACLGEAVTAADAVLSCVTGSASLALAEQAAQEMTPGSLFVDAPSWTPEAKEEAARVMEARHCGYADAAVLGAVAALGGNVPFMVAGSGASRFAEMSGHLGLTVTVLDGPAGRAARLKLIRSVFFKGRDALVAEMLIAAHRAGCAPELVASIGGPAEEVPFDVLAERICSSLARHAPRRAEELQASADVLRSLSVEPETADGAIRCLRSLDGAALEELSRVTRRS
jgi:3-hydroxyisobutyrate dehydrogenase-like beta-hydroxyacid dehydrogenase